MFTLCGVCFHGFWWMGFVHHSRTRENSSITIKISFCLPFKLAFPISLSSENHWYVFHPYSFAFFRCSQIIWSFLDLTFLLSKMYFRAIYVVWINSFLLLNSIPLYWCNRLFMYSSVEGHLDCFQLWVIMNKAAENITYRFLCEHSFYFTWINT